MMKNVREAGGAVVINDEKELSGLQGKLAGFHVTDLIFGLKIYIVNCCFIIYRHLQSSGISMTCLKARTIKELTARISLPEAFLEIWRLSPIKR